jgi:predicted dinucleotide-binding enzyme
MKIGILGSGNVAQTLAQGFAKQGHEVMVGTRDAQKLADWAKQNPNVKIATFDHAAQHGEVLVLAVKGASAADALRLVQATHLAGKTIIDATNPIKEAPPTHGVLNFFTSLDESLMERLQREFSSAHFVKAFNSVGASRMIQPQFKEGKPTMFSCGNDANAKNVVSKILDQCGWETADMGQAEAARAIEPLCMLWCIPGFLRNEWTHAFKLLR